MRIISLLPLALVVALAACSGGNGSDGTTTTSTNTTTTTTETAAAADDLPQVKPGLWEAKMTMPGPTGKPINATMKSCVGAPKPGENPFAPKLPGMSCTADVKRAGDGWSVSSDCTGNGVTTKTSGVVTGDPQSAYKNVMTSVSTGANVPPYLQKETQTVFDARRLGECPAGVNPGQMVP